VTATLLILLKVAVAGIILAIGMDSTLKDATYLWHRPGLLLRSVLAMYVLVPLAALALVKVLTLAPGVEIGLLVLAVSAGAPLLPRKLMKIGDGAYIFSLVVTSSLLAILVVPAWLAVLGAQLDYPVSLRPDQVALVLAKSFLLPLALGMVVRRLFPACRAGREPPDGRCGAGADGLRANAADPALGHPDHSKMVRGVDLGRPGCDLIGDRASARRSRRG